jgi:hypothetical protein
MKGAPATRGGCVLPCRNTSQKPRVGLGTMLSLGKRGLERRAKLARFTLTWSVRPGNRTSTTSGDQESLGALKNNGIRSYDQIGQLCKVGRNLFRNWVGSRNQDLWLLLSRLSRIAFRARDNNPSTDLGERPMI